MCVCIADVVDQAIYDMGSHMRNVLDADVVSYGSGLDRGVLE